MSQFFIFFFIVFLLPFNFLFSMERRSLEKSQRLHKKASERGSLSQHWQQRGEFLTSLSEQKNLKKVEEAKTLGSVSQEDFLSIQKFAQQCKQGNESKEEKKARRKKRRELKKQAKNLLEKGKLHLQNYEELNFEPRSEVTKVCIAVAENYIDAAQLYVYMLDLYAKEKGKKNIVQRITEIKEEINALESARGLFTERERITPIATIFTFYKLYRPLMEKYPTETQNKTENNSEKRQMIQDTKFVSFGSKFKQVQKQEPPKSKKSSSFINFLK